jgi:hypothetical protein
MGASRGGFFAVDRQVWHRVCRLGGINPATAYLVLAWGTGGDNRTTSCSVNAVEKYTPISRSRAKDAIGKLIKANAIARAPGRLPRYKIAVSKQPRWIWLPNEIVTGANGERPPLAMIHPSGDVMLLRLFVDLYDAQNLVEDGGVSRGVAWQNYDRSETGRYGEFIIFGFGQHGRNWVSIEADLVKPHIRQLSVREREVGRKAGKDSRGIDFWRRLGQLLAMGLAEWVPHLFGNESADAEIIHPYGMGSSDSIEDRLGRAAHQAGFAALTNAQRDRVREHGYRLAPMFSSQFQNAHMLGVLRMRYRTRSAMTAIWAARKAETCEEYIAIYEVIPAAHRAFQERRIIANRSQRATSR